VSASAAAGVFYLASYFASGRQAPPGFMTLLIAFLFLGSVQLVCFSILATYLGHIYEEVKRRPRFIVREVIDNRPPCRTAAGGGSSAGDGAPGENPAHGK
jgi:hypothetical protein